MPSVMWGCLTLSDFVFDFSCSGLILFSSYDSKVTWVASTFYSGIWFRFWFWPLVFVLIPGTQCQFDSNHVKLISPPSVIMLFPLMIWQFQKGRWIKVISLHEPRLTFLTRWLWLLTPALWIGIDHVPRNIPALASPSPSRNSHYQEVG